MINKVNLVLLLFVLLLFGCSATRTSEHDAELYSADALLKQLPAENNVQRDLVLSALLANNEQELLSIAAKLEAANGDEKVQAEYALHGMALYVSAKGQEKKREKYIAVIDNALQLTLSKESRVFLLEQLRFIPANQSVQIAGKYLRDNLLSESAVMVLQSQNSQAAGKMLQDAIGDVSNIQKISMIVALARINYRPAAETIFNLLPTEDNKLENAVVTCLAKLGYLPAEQFIRNYSRKAYSAENLLLSFAKSIAEQGNVAKSEMIFREVLEGDSTNFSTTDRIAALSGLTELSGARAFDDIVKAFDDSNKKIRVAALNLALQFNQDPYIQKWIEIAVDKPIDRQIEIINFLGEIKNNKAISYLKENLKNNDPLIQAAALNALYKIQLSEAAADIQGILKTDLQKELAEQVIVILNEFSDSLKLAQIVKDFAAYTLSGRQIIIQLISEKKLSAHAEILTDVLQSDNPDLKSAALEALFLLQEENTFPQLLDFFLNEENDQLKNKSVKALTAVFNSKNHSDVLLKAFDKGSAEDKLKIFEIFQKTGGSGFFAKTIRYTDSKNEILRDKARETLYNWPDNNALKKLVREAKTGKTDKSKILAIRAAVNILIKSDLNKDDKVGYCQVLLSAAERPEEKRLVFSVLSDLKNKAALKLILKMLDDPDIEFEAFLALNKWAETENNADHYTIEDLLVHVLDSRITDSLSEKIAKYRQEKFEPKPPEGFTALFNGRDLSGWKGLVANPVKRAKMSAAEMQTAQQKADSIMQEQWSVVDGVLYFKGIGYQNICTVKDYQNFELYLDWKIEKNGDSGIYLRGTPQVQIWDPGKSDEGSGGLYNNQNNVRAPLVRADKRVGEWNTFHIIMTGRRVTVYLNDILVVDNTILENYWERDKPIYNSGQIELQAHDNPLYFRNIFIKELPAEEQPIEGNLFNGKDLSGWQVINNTKDSWQVEGGVLFTEGQGGGWLSTEQKYSDFELQLEFRVPDGGNSGVFIRAPHEGDPAYTGMEIQVLDDYSPKYAALKPWQYTGSIYGLQAPAKRASKKANAWQKMRITCKGPRIKVVLNDEKIIEANLVEFGRSENKHPGIKNREGFIGLQNHSTRVEYRNIIIKELE